MRTLPDVDRGFRSRPDWAKLFSAGMLEAVDSALSGAANTRSTELKARRTPAQRARSWFIDHYPLLGALAAGFELVEDSALCQQLGIGIAAISEDERRSYARMSRRQSSTPDIPRPSYAADEAMLDGRTFGVVLDTSGSMQRSDIARGLGAIAAYAMSREVPMVRLVSCDAAAHDEG